MNLGVAPLALQFVIQVGAWMVKSRISSAQAAEQAAAEFDYFRRVSDAELTGIAFEMAERFPEYPYWRWMQILQNIRKYGMSREPRPQPPPVKEAAIDGGWIWIAVGIAVIFLLSQR